MVSSDPCVGIIIPVYNRRECLENCVDSIREQGYSNREIVVVDDGSSRGLATLERLADLYVRNDLNLGPAHARNLGAIATNGDLLLFIDSDTVLRPGTLGRLVEIFQADPSITALGGSGPPDSSGDDVRFISGKSYDRLGRSQTTRYLPVGGDYDGTIFDCDHVESAFLAVRRRAFEHIGGFDPFFGYMGEDRDLCLRLRDSSFRVVTCLDTRAIHLCLGDEEHSTDNSAYYSAFIQKCVQVAIKRGGHLGGALWMVGNYRTTLNPRYLFKVLAQFRHRRDLVGRRGRNYLKEAELDRSFAIGAAKVLNDRLPFQVESTLRSPRGIVLFVNAICNALCDHCFIIHDPLPAQDRRQIKLDDIVRLFSSLNAPASVSLTGGETFMRKDLSQMLQALMDLPRVDAVSVFSNGSTPRHIERICREACEGSATPLHLQLSLDGLAATNDAIRRIPDGFAKVLETCRLAALLDQEFPQFSFVVAITLMKQNLAEIEALVDELESRGYPSKISLARGNSFSTFGVPRDILDGEYNPNEDVLVDVDEVEALLDRTARRHPCYFDRFQQHKLRIMLDTLRTRRRQITCYAGYEDVVVYNDGSVALCEQVKPFGNLANWDWDLVKAWNSREAAEHRLKLTSCACIHGCNISTSIGMQDHGRLGNRLKRTLRSVVGA